MKRNPREYVRVKHDRRATHAVVPIPLIGAVQLTKPGAIGETIEARSVRRKHPIIVGESDAQTSGCVVVLSHGVITERLGSGTPGR